MPGNQLKSSGLDKEVIYAKLEKQGIPEELAEISPYFKSAIIEDSITTKFAREKGTAILIFKDSRININERIREEIEQTKNNDL